jgi:hypothetical protein
VPSALTGLTGGVSVTASLTAPQVRRSRIPKYPVSFAAEQGMQSLSRFRIYSPRLPSDKGPNCPIRNQRYRESVDRTRYMAADLEGNDEREPDGSPATKMVCARKG